MASASTGGSSAGPLPTVSVIIPAHNAAKTLDAALASAIASNFAGPIELCVYDDASTDATVDVLQAWHAKLSERGSSSGAGPRRIVTRGPADVPTDRAHGPGFARNRAVEASTGEWLCLLDADDLMAPERVDRQLQAALQSPNPHGTLVGCNIVRTPEGSTAAYTAWVNAMTAPEVALQAYREVGVIQPTWFMSRRVWETVGGWDEAPPVLWKAGAGGEEEGKTTAVGSGPAGAGALPSPPLLLPACKPLPRHPPILGRPPSRLTPAEMATAPNTAYPEDPIFLLRHLAAGGGIAKPADPAPLVTYTYSDSSQSWRMPREALLAVRVAMWEERVLFGGDKPWAQPAGQPCEACAGSAAPGGNKKGAPLAPRVDCRACWRPSFTIWGAGRDGKAFYNALSPAGKACVAAFADIDPHKIGQLYPQPPRVPKAVKQAAAAAAAAAAAGKEGEEEGGPRKRAKLDGEGGEVAAGGAVEAPPPMPPLPPPAPRDCPLLKNPASVPVLPYAAAKPPIVCCVALQRSAEELREKVAQLGLIEGDNFWFFV